MKSEHFFAAVRITPFSQGRSQMAIFGVAVPKRKLGKGLREGGRRGAWNKLMETYISYGQAKKNSYQKRLILCKIKLRGKEEYSRGSA
jgi:hypothetical protein